MADVDPARPWAALTSGAAPPAPVCWPPSGTAAACLKVANAADAQAGAFVAVGGGSAIDSAKCISLLRSNGGHPRDWEDFARCTVTRCPSWPSRPPRTAAVR